MVHNDVRHMRPQAFYTFLKQTENKVLNNYYTFRNQPHDKLKILRAFQSDLDAHYKWNEDGLLRVLRRGWNSDRAARRTIKRVIRGTILSQHLMGATSARITGLHAGLYQFGSVLFVASHFHVGNEYSLSGSRF